MSNEPKFGFTNLIKSNKAGKVKAFFSLRIPTESIGTIELAGFKVIEGSDGDFISLPNRAVPTNVRRTVDMSTGEQSGEVAGVKYYNNIRFDSKDHYNEFRKELNESVLPMIQSQLAR